MIRSGLVVIILTLSFTTAEAQNSSDVSPLLKWYYDNYPFMTMKDTVYTFESEFIFPEGFRRPDADELTPFQNWISRFPLWHQWRGVGYWKGGKMYEYEEISRPIHLPWRNSYFTDNTIPLRILAEWLYYTNRFSAFRIIPKAGDTLRFEDFLGGELRYNNRMEPFFVPGEKREPSPREFYKFVALCMQMTTYRSLAANCDPIAPSELRPGDLIIAEDETGRKGRVYIIMLMLVNNSGEKRYVVGCGCQEACDFHIPLLTDDRHRPWLETKDLKKLGDDYIKSGFYRLRID